MSISLSHPADLTISLSLEPHQQAEQFRKQQPTSLRGKQVYLNTLAIYATRFYLECLGFEPDLTASDGLNPLQQMLLLTAALAVESYGQIECCPVLPGATELEIGPEVWCDRIAYVAVQLEADLRTATLLGFVTTAAERIPLTQLQPMAALPQLLAPKIVQAVVQPAETQITQLSQWLDNLADEGWQALDSFINPVQLAFRSQATTNAADTTEVDNVIGRRKYLSLNGHAITLAVGLLPLNDTETELWVQVYGTNGTNGTDADGADAQTYLPHQLQLLVLDADSQEVMQAEARATESIQLKFTGSPGERFSLKLVLQDASVAETFII